MLKLNRRTIAILWVLLVLLPSCGVPATPTPGLQTAELKYILINRFGGIGESTGIHYCDPDRFPVGDIEYEKAQSQKLFPSIVTDSQTFAVILIHLNLPATTSFTDDQKLLIYREYKKLNSINFAQSLAGYSFTFYYQRNSGLFMVTGTISSQGDLTVEIQKPAQDFNFYCPICLVAGTLIGTPTGPVAVKDLQVGMSVWTMDKQGNRQAVHILKTARVTVPFGHTVVHLRLSDGRELWASPPHPTADGRLLGSLALGDSLDGATVTSVERVAYPDNATYDILPAGDTGFYWADGILMGSTLADPVQF